MSILLVDSYDSFTYNLRNLITSTTNANVITIHNDSYDLNIEDDKISLDNLLNSIDAIVIGPGPGSPSNPLDIGVIPYIFQKCTNLPILGICLGFQIFCLLNDCSTHYLNNPIHGQIHKIKVLNNDDIFKDTPEFVDSVRYHSIYVKQDNSKKIIPLAIYNPSDNNETTGDSILMAAKHIKYPHYGVQYHPESICSSFGSNLIKNFWNLVDKEAHTKPLPKIEPHLVKSSPLIEKFTTELSNFEYNLLNYKPVDSKFDILQICDTLKANNQDVMLLNSASAPGEWSIIALPQVNVSDVITHSTENPNTIKFSKWNNDEQIEEKHTNDIFKSLSEYMSNKYFNPVIENKELMSCPFVGGIIGYMSYEEGSFIDIQNLEKRTKNDNIDDTKFCFIDRFIALSPSNNIYIVSIRQNDNEFIKNIETILNKSDNNINDSIINDDLFKKSKITIPNKDDYFKSFHDCQKYLHSGDSYELCLTYNTIVQIPDNFQPWDIYKALVKKNPSPYSAYLNFNSSMLLSTSPERFISWNNKFCQMRPIKGTLKKNPNINYEKACKLLKIPKELGENLMIVDLIRDNLLFLLDKIEVTKLMTVEEYETIYQLVSVIEGNFTNEFTGIDILKNSLPPGSMTGAPKKRSVEILQKIEKNQRRGLYSGICGYWSLNNNADWSVIIRSLFRYSDDLCNENGYDTYRCGAGGALTVLSTDDGEWDEMLVKLHSVLQLFE